MTRSYSFDMMFATPHLEERFRALVAGKEEVGGFLMFRWKAPPAFRNWTQFERVAGTYRLYTVYSWLLIPNEAERKKVQFKMWDIQKAEAVAQQTACSMGWSTMDFHSHPSGHNAPSQNDLVYWGAHCNQYGWLAEAAIATPNPLRLYSYAIYFDRLNSPNAGQLERGAFLSWREKRFAPFRKLSGSGL